MIIIFNKHIEDILYSMEINILSPYIRELYLRNDISDSDIAKFKYSSNHRECISGVNIEKIGLVKNTPMYSIYLYNHFMGTLLDRIINSNVLPLYNSNTIINNANITVFDKYESAFLDNFTHVPSDKMDMLTTNINNLVDETISQYNLSQYCEHIIVPYRPNTPEIGIEIVDNVYAFRYNEAVMANKIMVDGEQTINDRIEIQNKYNTYDPFDIHINNKGIDEFIQVFSNFININKGSMLLVRKGVSILGSYCENKNVTFREDDDGGSIRVKHIDVEHDNEFYIPENIKKVVINNKAVSNDLYKFKLILNAFIKDSIHKDIDNDNIYYALSYLRGVKISKYKFNQTIFNIGTLLEHHTVTTINSFVFKNNECYMVTSVDGKQELKKCTRKMFILKMMRLNIINNSLLSFCKNNKDRYTVLKVLHEYILVYYSTVYNVTGAEDILDYLDIYFNTTIGNIKNMYSDVISKKITLENTIDHIKSLDISILNNLGQVLTNNGIYINIDKISRYVLTKVYITKMNEPNLNTYDAINVVRQNILERLDNV